MSIPPVISSPNSRAAEVGVISGVIGDGPEALAACFDGGVTPATFYFTPHARVFAEILAMHAEGKPISAPTVGERIRDRGLLAEIGGWPGFTEMTQQPPVSTELRAHVREIVALETRRNVMACCTALNEAAAENPDAVPELMVRLLQTQARSESTRTWKTVVAEAAIRAEAAIAGRKPTEENTLGFGFADLDHNFHRLRRKELVVVAGRPSCGKSSLMRAIVEANARASASVLVESLEVPADDIADALAATAAGVNGFALANAHPRDQADYVAAIRRLDRDNLHVFDCDRSLAAIVARAKAIHAVRPLDLLAIDYLGLIRDCEQAGRSETKAGAVGRVTKAIKSIAMELNCVIVLLCQLNRDSVRDGNREPRLSDLRDSGDIEQDADRVIFIHRPDTDPITGLAQADTDDLRDRPRFFQNLIQAKGRNVGTGIVSAYFARATTRFVAIDHRAPL